MLPPAPPGRILVIDDEESLRLGLTKGLVRQGFEALGVATGKEGVERFAAGGFDAVLTDVRLPDLSGLDVVAILTEMDADVPIVVMTGYGTVDMALEALRRGAKDYVNKPFAVDDVGRVLTRAIEERRLSRENRRLRALVERRFASSGYEQVDAVLAARRSAAEAAGQAPPSAAPNGHAQAGTGGQSAPPAAPPTLREAQKRFEIDYVADLLARTGGNIAAAARLAQISRPNFHKKLQVLGVDPGAFKQAARRGRAREG